MTPGFLVFLVVIALAMSSMALFRLRGRPRDADAQAKGGQFMGGLGAFVLDWFMWAITPLVTLSRRLGLTPDFYNYAGLVLGVASGPLIARGQLELAGWATALSGIA